MRAARTLTIVKPSRSGCPFFCTTCSYMLALALCALIARRETLAISARTCSLYVSMAASGDTHLHVAALELRIAATVLGLDDDTHDGDLEVRPATPIALNRLGNRPHGGADATPTIRQRGEQQLVGRHGELGAGAANLAAGVVPGVHRVLDRVVARPARVGRGLAQLDDRPERVFQRLGQQLAPRAHVHSASAKIESFSGMSSSSEAPYDFTPSTSPAACVASSSMPEWLMTC